MNRQRKWHSFELKLTETEVPGFRTDKVGWQETIDGLVWQANRRGHAEIQGKTTIDFGRGRGVKSAPMVNKSSRKGMVVFRK